MTTLVLAPFLFDNDFDCAEATAAITPDCAADAMRPAQMEQAIAEARAEGFAEGHRFGVADANAAVDRRTADALDALKGQFASLGDDMRRREEAIARQAAALAAMLCRKFLPSRYEEAAVDGILELLGRFLPRLGEISKVTVWVAEDLVASVTDQLNETARCAGFAGLVETLGDPQMVEGDCRIEWPRGGVNRGSAALWREIEALLEETLVATSVDPSASAFLPDNPLKRVSRDA